MVLLSWGSGISWRVNYIEYDDDSHQIVYSQTRRDLNDLMERVEEYAHSKAQGYDTEIKIKYFDSAWGAVMKVLWSPPGQGEGPIPPRYFWHR